MSEGWKGPAFDDAAGARFFDELRARRLCFPRCTACRLTFVPPRTRCSQCLSRDLRWVEAPRRGTLYAFTWQEMGLRFSKPDVLGIVELALPEGPARILTRIDAPFTSLRVGMELELDFIDAGDQMVLHQFRPTVGATP
jgi:uncharacterized OB-fold protein